MDILGRKRINELEGLVSHLKKDKSAQRRNALKLLRRCLDQDAITSIGFIRRDKDLTRNPYMFVDRKGIILGYTHALETALGITEDVRGKHYLEVFQFENGNAESRRSLKSYLSSPREISIPYERMDGKKTRRLTITKGEPVYTEEIDLSPLYSKKKIRAVAFVPIRVSSRRRTVRNIIGMSSKDKIERESQLNETEIRLIVDHGWKSEQVDAYKVEHGEKGIIDEYHRLEKESI